MCALIDIQKEVQDYLHYKMENMIHLVGFMEQIITPFRLHNIDQYEVSWIIYAMHDEASI